MDIQITSKGLQEIQDQIARGPDAFDDLIVESLKKIGEHLATRAAANAPEEHLDLRASLRPTPVAVLGNSKFKIWVQSDLPYAFKMHEDLLPYGTTRGRPLYVRGPLASRAVPHIPGPGYETPTTEGTTGGRYIRRAANYWAQKYILFIGEVLFENYGPALKQTRIKIRNRI